MNFHGTCKKCEGPVECLGVTNSTGRYADRRCIICAQLEREVRSYGLFKVGDDEKEVSYFYCATCLAGDKSLHASVDVDTALTKFVAHFRLSTTRLATAGLPRGGFGRLQSFLTPKEMTLYYIVLNTRPAQIQVIPKEQVCRCNNCGPRFDRA